MAMSLQDIKDFLTDIGFNFQEKDEESLLFPYSDSDIDEKILVLVKLQEGGEFLSMRTVKHLDELVAEATEEKRRALLEWMLFQNYRTKIGTWEYDPTDHDHHLAVSAGIEDGVLTKKQLMRMLAVMVKSVELIPEMKKILGIEPAGNDQSEADKKRAELLAQLAALDEPNGI